jgi:tetratricopeptide (TPR) repeat protein
MATHSPFVLSLSKDRTVLRTGLSKGAHALVARQAHRERKRRRNCEMPYLGIVLLCASGLLAPAVLVDARAEDPVEMRARGFDLAYNLDHEAAFETLSSAAREAPRDPASYRSLAAIIWLRILFVRGGITVDDYVGGVSRPTGKLERPPPDLHQQFKEYAARAVELSEEMVERAPNDASAHYELGASVGLVASYIGSIEGEPLKALGDARRAYQEHEKVLELDPTRKDANLILGLYRYVVAILPAPLRVMAYLVGFEGGKDRAIRMIEEAAAYESEARTEARLALVLLYNRERRYDPAQRVLEELQRLYPRNRLVWLELASTALRADRPAAAERVLREGFAILEGDTRPRMFGEAALWRYKRGAARVGLRRPRDARPDLDAAIAAEAKPWIKGRAYLELGKIADLAGDRQRARTEYDRARRLCKQARDRRCTDAADQLKKTPYKPT